jgi:hypothetical protein
MLANRPSNVGRMGGERERVICERTRKEYMQRKQDNVDRKIRQKHGVQNRKERE